MCKQNLTVYYLIFFHNKRKEVIDNENNPNWWWPRILGDLSDAPITMAKQDTLDYICCDYLAELTLSIMRRQQEKGQKLDMHVILLKL